MADHSKLNDELQRLLEQCVQGDQSAFNDLYETTSSRLYATLLKILRIEAVAEEALQETYVKIWNKASEYRRDISQPLTWMTSIARYEAIDMLRKRRIREDKETVWEGIALLEAVVSEPDPSMMAEYQDILDKCFDKLTENQRLCIVRAFLEGRTHDELSESIQSPVGTIKSWIRRGLVSLKECISDHA